MTLPIQQKIFPLEASFHSQVKVKYKIFETPTIA